MNVSGTGPLKLTGSADSPLQNLKLFGKSVQNGTPSPDNPIAIENIDISREMEWIQKWKQEKKKGETHE